MTEQGNDKQYIMTKENQKYHIHVSYIDHRAVKWWANHRKITIAAALHEMIGAFMGPKLVEVQEEAIFQAVREGKLPQKAADGIFRRLLNVKRGLRPRGLTQKRKLRARLPPEK